MMRLLLRTLLCMTVGATVLLAQARDQREATVGMRAYVEQIVLEGPELAPARSSEDADIVVRIVKTWPHGDNLRYDIEWYGFEPGTYDLIKFMVRKDGSSTEGLPAIKVKVTSVLPEGEFEPSDIDSAAAQRLDGYSTTQIVVGVLWGVGLLSILFVGRKWSRKPPPAKAPPTLADRLRPLIAEVVSGTADTARKAELERLLVAHWREKLDLGKGRAVDAIMTIRKHEEAGALIRQVEAWLHAPEPPASMDLAGLLRPYNSVPASDPSSGGGA